MTNSNVQQRDIESLLSLIEGQVLPHVERGASSPEEIVQKRREAVRFALQGNISTSGDPRAVAEVIDEYCRQEWYVHEKRFD